MRASRTELIVQLDGARSVVSHDGALAGGALHPAVAEALIAQARSVADRVPLTIRFIAMESDGVSTDSVAAVVRAHFARMAQRHTQQISDIFRFARVATALGLLVVVVLLACAQAIPDEASKLMLGVRESLTIFAWVAMWRPAELWLYAHLPERHWRRLAGRLSDARVLVESSTGTSGTTRQANPSP
ncbi:MAG: hypothetical protein KA225_01150 [Thauera sp.]|nr:hypothetical protein [Thauera sp.]